MREYTVCFTGHRKIPSAQLRKIARRLENTIIELINQGYKYFGAGGALGFDTLAAKTVLKLKRKYPEIRLILVLPCLSQTRGWSKKEIEVYENIKQNADKVVYTSNEYTKDCMFKRNRHLVNNSSVCICYLTENEGGTAYTVKYAVRKELKIINLAC